MTWVVATPEEAEGVVAVVGAAGCLARTARLENTGYDEEHEKKAQNCKERKHKYISFKYIKVNVVLKTNKQQARRFVSHRVQCTEETVCSIRCTHVDEVHMYGMWERVVVLVHPVS